jgi:hypothetical protein
MLHFAAEFHSPASHSYANMEEHMNTTTGTKSLLIAMILISLAGCDAAERDALKTQVASMEQELGVRRT